MPAPTRTAAARRDPAVARARDHGRLVERIIPRNSTIPTARARRTSPPQGRPDRDGHPRGAGRARAGVRLRSLARFELRGIPPMVAGAARIRVTFQVDADGLLSGRRPRGGLRRAGGRQRQAELRPGRRRHRLACSARASPPPKRTCAGSLRESRVEAERMLLPHAQPGRRRRPARCRAAPPIDAELEAVQQAREGNRPPPYRCRRRSPGQGTEAFAATHEPRHPPGAGGQTRRGRLTMPVIRILPHPSTVPRAPRSRRAPAPRSARPCWRTTSRSSTPAR